MVYILEKCLIYMNIKKNMVGIAHNIPEIISPSLKEEIVANKQLIVSMAKNPPTIDKIENLNNNTNIKMIIIVEKILIFCPPA